MAIVLILISSNQEFLEDGQYRSRDQLYQFKVLKGIDCKMPQIAALPLCSKYCAGPADAAGILPGQIQQLQKELGAVNAAFCLFRFDVNKIEAKILL